MNIKKILHIYKFAYSKDFVQKVKDIESYIPNDYRNKLLQTTRKQFIRLGIQPEEYLKYCFFQKTKKEQADYLSDRLAREIYGSSNWNLFPRSKYKRYILFKPFFKRDIVYLALNSNESATEQEYMAFGKRNSSFVVKPIKGTKGHGVHICYFKDNQNINSLIESNGEELLLESIIVQGKELAQFHPASVNTLRIVTALNSKGEFTVLFALLRMGMGDSFVDNVGSGGCIALIDLATGKVCTDALCGNQFFQTHPDTHIQFNGFSIPKWGILCDTAEAAHRTFPKQRLIGWDFAWTTDEIWDLVEANPRPSFVSYQTLSGKGIRPLLKKAGIL